MWIESADGKSKLILTSDGKMRSLSVIVDAEAAAAHTGQAWIIHGRCNLAAAASGGLALLHFHTAGYHFHITRIFFDAHTLSKDIIVSQLKSPTRSGGGSEIGSTAFVNKNWASTNTFNGHFYVSTSGSQIAYSSEGTPYHAFPLKSLSSTMRDMRGTNQLSQLSYIGWKWETADGTNAATTDVVSISINGYLESEATVEDI
jgi:hypothetical protein